jgi:uncharacterized damage-inducible protein DinB
MPVTDPKDDLQLYLQRARDTLVWKLEGLSEYDIRRPMVPTGTNLLGLVKHAAYVEFAYFGETFGRPPSVELEAFAEGAEPNADMWATPEESRDEILGFYRDAWTHADATIAALPLDTLGSVAWWPEERREVTLHRLLIHVIVETDRHAGQADIVRELIDGAAGLRADSTNLPEEPEKWWKEYRDKLESAARTAQETWGNSDS